MAAVHHLGFWKFAVFVMWPLSACRSASWCKISLKSDNRLMNYGQNSDFQDGGLNFKNFNSWSRDCNRVQYLRYGDLTISKWRPSAILDFKICSFCRGFCRHAVLLPRTKFSWYRTIGRWDMAKQAIFKMAAAAILNFKQFLVTWLSSGSISAVVF